MTLMVSIGCGPEIPPTTGMTEKFPITSFYTNTNYDLFVRTPPGYDPASASGYALIIQLDATFVGIQQFDKAAHRSIRG